MPQPTPVTRSRLPWIAVAVWAAILISLLAVSLAFAGRGAPGNGATTVGAGGAQANQLAPLAASPSPDASAGTQPANGDSDDHSGDSKSSRKGLRLFGSGGPDGRGDGHGRGRGVTITAINGTQLSLKTDDGWTRTIDAAGATIKEGDQTIAVGDLRVGDQIGFRQTRNSDGTYKVTDIRRIPPHAAGVVKSVDGSSVTLTQPDGTTRTIVLTGSTVYSLAGASATRDAIKVGTRVHAQGTVAADGTFTATKVAIAPAVVIGRVTATTNSTITVTTFGNAAATINVDASTTYAARGNASAGLADVAVGSIVRAAGAQNADGSLQASRVHIFVGQDGGSFAPFRGGHGRDGHGRPGGHNRQSRDQPNPSAGTTSS